MIPALAWTAFAGDRLLQSGAPADVARAMRQALADDPAAAILAFDDRSGRVVDVDLRGSEDDVAARLAPDDGPRQPGRPKLGVVPREVTLLPEQWAWLGEQPGGASGTLRRLVEAARQSPEAAARGAQAAADRFMAAMLGNQPGYEEASRALYAGDRERFLVHSRNWPAGLRDFARRLAGPAFAEAD